MKKKSAEDYLDKLLNSVNDERARKDKFKETAKMIEDALKGVLIKDDSPKYVRSMTIGFHDEHYIRVLVEPYKPFQGV